MLDGDARLEARVATEQYQGVDRLEEVGEVGLPQLGRGTLVGEHQGLIGQMGG